MPNLGETTSLSIPRRTPISLMMNFETDPLHEVVCAASFNLNMFIGDWQEKVHFDGVRMWWQRWKDYYEEKADLNETIEKITQYFDTVDINNSNNAFLLSQFGTALRYLISKRYDNRWPWVSLDRESRSGTTRYHLASFQIVLVNEGFTLKDENRLSEDLISVLYALIIVMQSLEVFLSKEREAFHSAIFYWSRVQIKHMQDFIERNLDYINDHPDLRQKMYYIIRWFNPSESSVDNPHHHKKIFDLRVFAESTLNAPLIINYTWHEIAHYLSTIPTYESYFNRRVWTAYHVFWNPHFNYIDFQQWHKYLHLKKKNDLIKETEQYKEFQKQMIEKVNIIDKLRTIFQDIGKNYIPGYNKPHSLKSFYDFDLGENYHHIAHIWNLFEHYTTVRGQMEVDLLRSLYPEFGIGKLETAKLEKIEIFPRDNGKFYYEFELKGVSSNVKIKEGEWVTCIPELVRHQPRFKLKEWQVVIDKMYWKGDHFKVSTHPWNANLLENYMKALEESKPFVDATLVPIFEERITRLKQIKKDTHNFSHPAELSDIFYIYPKASNPWKKKLKALVHLLNYGTSWLGYILAIKWGITKTTELKYPSTFPYIGWMPEVYMYAPNLLPISSRKTANLLTTISPTPDHSQTQAINNALASTIYGIQGPPGTGKTQTIAALIDEFILRNPHKTPLRILITTFSYAALSVVFNDVIKSTNSEGSPTHAARSVFAFLRSGEQTIPNIDKDFWDLHFTPKQKELKAQFYSLGTTATGDLHSISNHTSKKLESILCKEERPLILFGNAHQLYNLNKLHYRESEFINFGFYVDLIIVDEASQMPVNYFLVPLQYVNNFSVKITTEGSTPEAGSVITSMEELNHLRLEQNDSDSTSQMAVQLSDVTKVVIVGDQNQLPPVQPIQPPKRLIPVLDNLFGYYCEYHHIDNKQLEYNYRSNQEIVDYTNYLEIYANKIQAIANKDSQITGTLETIEEWNKKNNYTIDEWTLKVLHPSMIVGTLIHGRKYETAVSELEATLVCQIVMGFYLMVMPDLENSSQSDLERAEKEFWNEKLGIVAPHNAQGRLIIKKLYDLFIKAEVNFLPSQEFMEILKTTVYSVEKFQGSARDLIVASIGISATDQLQAETEFIYDLNRFNVLTSRARFKFVLIASNNFLTYIPNNLSLMENASKIRRFPLDYCNFAESIQITGINEEIIFRYRKNS